MYHKLGKLNQLFNRVSQNTLGLFQHENRVLSKNIVASDFQHTFRILEIGHTYRDFRVVIVYFGQLIADQYTKL